MKWNMFNRLFACSLAILSCSYASAQVTQLVDSIKNIYAPDNNLAIWEVKAEKLGGEWIITGKSDNKTPIIELDKALSKKGIKYKDNITLLPDGVKSEWALLRLPQEYMRRTPGNSQELLTQATMGMPLRILEANGDWVRAQTPDKYISWIKTESLKYMTPEEFKNWKSSDRYIVTAMQTYLYGSDKFIPTDVVTDLLLGNILTYAGETNNAIKLITPDGRVGFIAKNDVEKLNDWVNQPFDAEFIINVARRMMGSTYLWGGNTPKGVDCSGLTKMCYYANGIILMRDAYQQALYGKKIAPKDWKEAKAGDLIYFHNKNGRVTHTAIYLGNGDYIHSSGQVKINSIDPESSKKELLRSVTSFNRINGEVNTQGITAVKNHPWYYNK